MLQGMSEGESDGGAISIGDCHFGQCTVKVHGVCADCEFRLHFAHSANKITLYY